MQPCHAESLPLILTRNTNFKYEVEGGGGPCNNQGVVQLGKKYLQVYFHHSSPTHAPMQFGSSTAISTHSTYFYLLEEARQRNMILIK